MRRLRRVLAVVAFTLVAIATTASTASAGWEPVCGVDGRTYTVRASRYDTMSNTSRLAYAATASSTLRCAEGHPDDGVALELREAAELRLGDPAAGGECFQPADDGVTGVRRVRGRSSVWFVRGDRAVTFDGSVEGTVQPNASGDCVLTLEVRAKGARGSKLILRETGIINPSTGALENLVLHEAVATADEDGFVWLQFADG